MTSRSKGNQAWRHHGSLAERQAFSFPIVHLPAPTVRASLERMAEGDDPVFLRRDHTHLWRLPEPLPRRFPLIDLGWLLAVAAAVIGAVLLALP